MHVQNLIASNPRWLDILRDEFKIHVVTDGDLVSLKYNQIESPMHEPIVQECRGMVVDTATGMVLAHPYNKFWNHGDTLAAPIDWPSARVLEKIDGSLMILYWHAGQWCVASSGHPTAGGSFGDEPYTFREAFWRTWHRLEMRWPASKWSHCCFMFELCDAPNRVVVRHDSPRIVLHGARDLATGDELTLDELGWIAEDHDWDLVRSFPISSIDDCLAAAAALDPIQQEGFIVVDAAFGRVKIKSPRYVILHHMKGEATLRRAIELWQTGETQELLGHFPEFAPKILPVHDRLDQIAAVAAMETGVAAAATGTRKEFALAVKDQPWSSVAFKLYGAEVTADAAKRVMRAASLQSLERMLESDGTAWMREVGA